MQSIEQLIREIAELNYRVIFESNDGVLRVKLEDRRRLELVAYQNVDGTGTDAIIEALKPLLAHARGL